MSQVIEQKESDIESDDGDNFQTKYQRDLFLRITEVKWSILWEKVIKTFINLEMSIAQPSILVW